MIAIKDLTLSGILEAARANNEMVKPFWIDGEIAEQIRDLVADNTTYKRLNRLRTWLLENGHPVWDIELKQLLLWQQKQGRAAKIPVLGFKYLLLKEEEKNAGKWTLEADKAAETLAIGIIHKQKELEGH